MSAFSAVISAATACAHGHADEKEDIMSAPWQTLGSDAAVPCDCTHITAPNGGSSWWRPRHASVGSIRARAGQCCERPLRRLMELPRETLEDINFPGISQTASEPNLGGEAARRSLSSGWNDDRERRAACPQRRGTCIDGVTRPHNALLAGASAQCAASGGVKGQVQAVTTVQVVLMCCLQ